MSELPEIVYVGAVPYKVIFPFKFDVNPYDYIGLHCPYIAEIRISDISVGGRPICEQTLKETFLHEIVHAVDSIYCGGILEEDTVAKTSFNLFQILCENDFTKDLDKVKIGAFIFNIKTDCVFSDNDILTHWCSMIDTIKIVESVDGIKINPIFTRMMVFTTVMRVAYDLNKIDLPELNEEMDKREVLHKILFSGLYDTLSKNNLFEFFYNGK